MIPNKSEFALLWITWDDSSVISYFWVRDYVNVLLTYGKQKTTSVLYPRLFLWTENHCHQIKLTKSCFDDQSVARVEMIHRCMQVNNDRWLSVLAHRETMLLQLESVASFRPSCIMYVCGRQFLSAELRSEQCNAALTSALTSSVIIAVLASATAIMLVCSSRPAL